MLDVPVKYRCFRHGSCLVSLEVPFFPNMAPYAPLRWSWTKLCGGSALGIDVRGEVNTGREKRRLLVSDGAENRSDMFLPWLVDEDANTHKVFLINDVARSLEPEVALRSLRVRCLDTIRCSARISEQVPKVLSASSPLELDVEYSCLTSGSSMVQLMMVTEGHDPVVATWAKDCSAFSDSVFGIFLFAFFGCCCSSLACVAFSDQACGLFQSAEGDDDKKEDKGGDWRLVSSPPDDAGDDIPESAEALAQGRLREPLRSGDLPPGSAPGTHASLASA
jgi:hypothetical protein